MTRSRRLLIIVSIDASPAIQCLVRPASLVMLLIHSDLQKAHVDQRIGLVSHTLRGANLIEICLILFFIIFFLFFSGIICYMYDIASVSAFRRWCPSRIVVPDITKDRRLILLFFR